jgi:hypothetical protein
VSLVRVRTKTAYRYSADPRCGPCRMHGGSSGRTPRRTWCGTRRFLGDVTETGQTGGWTAAQDGDPPVYLPVPAGATGYAYRVSASGAIMGSIKHANGQDQPVLWTKRTSDVEPPFAR